MKQNTGVERQNIFFFFVFTGKFVCLFVPPSFLKTAWEEEREHLVAALFSGCLSFLLLISRLCIALLSAVSSHSRSSSEATVNFPAAQKTEQHQRL